MSEDNDLPRIIARADELRLKVEGLAAKGAAAAAPFSAEELGLIAGCLFVWILNNRPAGSRAGTERHA